MRNLCERNGKFSYKNQEQSEQNGQKERLKSTINCRADHSGRAV
jgi:hypothetical protein